jgi:hypothetical protein
MSSPSKSTNDVDANSPEPRLFSLVRNFDESKISGTGRVLDGVIFHNGQVVICWRSDIDKNNPGFSSLGVYPSWEAFMHVHIDPHPDNKTEIRFLSQ